MRSPSIINANPTDILLAACDGSNCVSPMMGAWYDKVISRFKAKGKGLGKKVTKAYRKVPWDKVHAVAKIAGPIVAVAYPPAAPAVAAAVALTYAASKGDPKAILAKENIERAAAAGVPAAAEALQALEVAESIQRQESASKVISAIQGGDVGMKAKMAMLREFEGMDPRAAQATDAVRQALKGQTPEYRAKVSAMLGQARAEFKGDNPDLDYARWQARREAYRAEF